MSGVENNKLKIVFMGTPEFSVPTLKKLIANAEVVAVYTQPDKPVGRGLQMQPSPVKKVALEHNIPVFTPEKVSIPEEVDRLVKYDADFIVVVAYGQILKLPVIQANRYGCINIHSSLLPRWRGAAPIQWAILGGDQVTGVTTMMIAPKLDAGDMLLQETTPITADDTAATVHDRLSEIGAKLILPTLEGLKAGTLKRQVQDESLVTYAAKLSKEMEFVDWSKTATHVDLAVRALNPWPGIKVETESFRINDFTKTDATKVTVENKMQSSVSLKLKIKKGKTYSGFGIAATGSEVTLSPKVPGTLFTQGADLLLHCGEGIYQILELQEEGKKPVQTADFLNGLKGRGIALPLQLVPAETLKGAAHA
jgi:methionyl-tRNA formyltransferase